ncbi:MAG: START domain-containing protein [Saprospiraceae bacterium]|nr:START domain-containing protein [Saprospiraceae bacterium]
MKHKFLFFAFALLAMTPAFSQQNEWKLKKQVDDLKVYVRKSEHSTIKEIKVVYTAEASLSNIIAVLRDVSAFPEWIYACSETKLLERPSDTETIYYSKMDFPFPMSDRDFVAKSKLSQDTRTKEIHILVNGLPNHIPAKENIVRLPSLHINWHITPVSLKKAIVEYHLVSDPGGWIPDWAVNMAIDKGPVNSMKEFKEMLTKEKYKSTKLAFIQETDAAALRLLGK